ncbi:deoxyribose-phosphate aldolase [Oceanisphaera avium]|uniref:Deoxyribose-phosphate aldolase n=1 Tax=Oceanisphaera avium TaxID=1903694 RepID=A0A1Y0CXN1_9GAMM|nr:deoxyribose-phosphate aldolase [Oceanisphaera avium]ART80008.1 deoxyribose-phosphate aldolase [Oceanisphaera avium]
MSTCQGALTDCLAAKKTLTMLDLTRLNDIDTAQSISHLCQQARTPFGTVAAICVYPRFISTLVAGLAELNLSDQVAIATVVNFPKGQERISRVEQDIELALAAGAQEIDLVLPYRSLIKGDEQTPLAMVQAAHNVCAKAALPILLKVIIESGELKSPALITKACQIAIAGGANFIKTSSGKVPINATLEAAELILSAIKDSGQPIGIKISGGVRTTAQARQYLALAASIMGEHWLTPSHLRFGASSLLNELLHTLENKA